MVMVRVKQLYLMLDGYRDSSQIRNYIFLKGFFECMNFHMSSSYTVTCISEVNSSKGKPYTAACCFLSLDTVYFSCCEWGLNYTR